MDLEQIKPKILTFVHILRSFAFTNYACLKWYFYAIKIVRINLHCLCINSV